MRLSVAIYAVQTFRFIHSVHCVMNNFPLTHTLSLSHICPSVSSDLCLVSAGHACHSELQTNNSWLFFGQFVVVACPFQVAIALLPALCPAAALYHPLCVSVLCGLLSHLLRLPLHFFVGDGCSQDERTGTRWQATRVGMLIPGRRRSGELRGDHWGHAELLEPLDRETYSSTQFNFKAQLTDKNIKKLVLG